MLSRYISWDQEQNLCSAPYCWHVGIVIRDQIWTSSTVTVSERPAKVQTYPHSLVSEIDIASTELVSFFFVFVITV